MALLSPPQWIKALTARERTDLLSRLHDLANGWDAEAAQMRQECPPSADETSVRVDVRARVLISVAAELRKELDAAG